MGISGSFERQRLLVAVLVSREGRVGAGNEAAAPGALEPLFTELVRRFGAIDFASEIMDFAWTDYYDEEMGGGLGRLILSFERLVDPSELASIKLWTNELEGRFALRGRRSLNLDPGLLSLGGLVLATTKNRSHRIALSDGIYAELTLMYKDGAYRGLPWTYSDWRSEAYAPILAELRARLKEALRAKQGRGR